MARPGPAAGCRRAFDRLTRLETVLDESVPDRRPGYVCFDRDNVRTALHRGNGVETCGLPSPDNVLVMGERAQGSDALSHLFGQALVAVQTLRNSPEGRERFTEKVAAPGRGTACRKASGPRRSSSRSC